MPRVVGGSFEWVQYREAKATLLHALSALRAHDANASAAGMGEAERKNLRGNMRSMQNRLLEHGARCLTAGCFGFSVSHERGKLKGSIGSRHVYTSNFRGIRLKDIPEGRSRWVANVSSGAPEPWSDPLCSSTTEQSQALYRGLSIHVGISTTQGLQIWPGTIQLQSVGAHMSPRVRHLFDLVFATLPQNEQRNRRRAAQGAEAQQQARLQAYDLESMSPLSIQAMRGELHVKVSTLLGPGLRYALKSSSEFAKWQDGALEAAGFGARTEWRGLANRVRTPHIAARLDIGAGTTFEHGKRYSALATGGQHPWLDAPLAVAGNAASARAVMPSESFKEGSSRRGCASGRIRHRGNESVGYSGRLWPLAGRRLAACG